MARSNSGRGPGIRRFDLRKEHLCRHDSEPVEGVMYRAQGHGIFVNTRAKADLIGYLEKHAAEIIDYGRRQASGKVIGCGRMEKGVDQVIGICQKNRGMSWSKTGSRALALLKVAQLNARQEVPC